LAKGVYAPENAEVRKTRIAVYSCPSSTYSYSAKTPGGMELSQSSYTGCHHDVEAPINVDQNGVFYLNSSVRYEQIRDGATNTIFMGEKIDTPTTLGWVSGTRDTLRNASSINRPDPDDARRRQGMNIPPEPNQVGGFGSFHAGGAQFGLGDGSVRFLSENIDPEVLKNLGNRADGAIIGDF
jgi:hypothetical protein